MLMYNLEYEWNINVYFNFNVRGSLMANESEPATRVMFLLMEFFFFPIAM